MNAIELTHVCKAFPGFAIQDLSLAVPSGTICGLVGENGAGKTTAIMNVTKSYSLKGLDCPNCSAKIEKEVGELDGVQSSVVNLSLIHI